MDTMQTQMQSDRNIYDAYVNDSDAIGTHLRYGKTIAISDAMENEWKDYSNSDLDLDLALDDFIGLQYTTGPDGKNLPVA